MPMKPLCVGVVGFDITPEIHPEYGAFGTTPSLIEVAEPLLSRCIALEQDGTRLVWFGSDLCGNAIFETDAMRREVADALDLSYEQVIWSTSQTHSSPTLPGSKMCGGSGITERGTYDAEYSGTRLVKFMNAFKDAGREAIGRLQPTSIRVGKGHCDSMSYNTRFPMPNGGVKFSRHHSEGLQSGKYVDPTLGLVRFDDQGGRPLGAIFNFCCHPATLICGSAMSPDWVGEARRYVEEAIDGAPAMFVQGFCGDVNCYHLFGTLSQARRNGEKLGRSAAAAIEHLVPMRVEPLRLAWKTIEIQCRPMYDRAELEDQIASRHQYFEELKDDPTAVWTCGINVPEISQFSSEEKTKHFQIHIDYLREGLRLLETGDPVRTSLDITLGVLRLGDMAAALSPGENFTGTGARLRERSPFLHTLICGDTNGNFGYIGDDAAIDQGGYETDGYWKMLYVDGFRLAPTKGTVDRILQGYDALFGEIAGNS